MRIAKVKRMLLPVMMTALTKKRLHMASEVLLPIMNM